MKIENITDAINANRVRITDHADEEAVSDGLTFDEIYYSVLHGEIIEDYPIDNPYPSCLIYGQTFSGDPVHSVWAFNNESKFTVLITVYRPDEKLWINFSKRR